MTASGSASYRWQHVPGQELVLLAGDLVRARYHFATDRREAFVHPLQTADGILMTATERARLYAAATTQVVVALGR